MHLLKLLWLSLTLSFPKPVKLRTQRPVTRGNWPKEFRSIGWNYPSKANFLTFPTLTRNMGSQSLCHRGFWADITFSKGKPGPRRSLTSKMSSHVGSRASGCPTIHALSLSMQLGIWQAISLSPVRWGGWTSWFLVFVKTVCWARQIASWGSVSPSVKWRCLAYISASQPWLLRKNHLGRFFPPNISMGAPLHVWLRATALCDLSVYGSTVSPAHSREQNGRPPRLLTHSSRDASSHACPLDWPPHSWGWGSSTTTCSINICVCVGGGD